MAGERLTQASVIWFLVPDVGGKLYKVRGLDEAQHTDGVVEVQSEVFPGDHLHVLRSSKDRVGWIRYHGDDV